MESQILLGLVAHSKDFSFKSEAGAIEGSEQRSDMV